MSIVNGAYPCAHHLTACCLLFNGTYRATGSHALGLDALLLCISVRPGVPGTSVHTIGVAAQHDIAMHAQLHVQL